MTLPAPRRVAAVVVAVISSVLLTACGSDDTTGSVPVTSPTDASSEAVAAEPTSAAALSARDDVSRIAPQLESYYRGGDYPESLDEVLATLDRAGVELSDGNTVAGYAYDASAVEFTLCIEADTGAWATYDTAPMTIQESGESGGCAAA